MLIVFPFAYLVGSAGADLWGRTANRPAWFHTARHLNLLGLATAVIAAAPGSTTCSRSRRTALRKSGRHST
jgi:uncharacterized membrane protein